MNSAWRGVGWWTVMPFLLMVLLAPLASGLDPRGALGQYGWQVWQTGDGPGRNGGLPQNTVRALMQTPDGYLWLGTDDGLVRFNGVEFKVFTAATTPALGSSAVEGLTVDEAGRLWVVTSGGLSVFAGGGFRAIGAADGLPEGTVWFVHRGLGGRLWVATAGGLCLMRAIRCEAVAATRGVSVSRESRFAEVADGGVWLAEGAETVELNASLTKVATLRAMGGAEIMAQVVDGRGRLLVGTAEGLQVVRVGMLTPVEMEGLAGRVGVTALLAAADGSTWVGTSAGLVHGVGERFAVVGGSASLGSASVQMLFQDREGAVWVGTERGIARVVGERVEEFGRGDALAESSVLVSLEDREGNLWLGTEADGLTMLHEQKFTTYTTVKGLSGNVVRSVFEDAAGTVWVGTDGAGLNRRTAEGFVGMTTREGLSSNVILSMAGGADGDLWVGTPTGLNQVRGGRVRMLTTADGLADDFIRSLLVDRAGTVWVGTRHGLTRIAKGGMSTFTALDGLGSDFIGVMVEARAGGLWIGTSGGLTRMVQGRFTNYRVGDGSAKNAVTAIHEDGAGVLWLGTNGSGLSRMRDGVIATVGAGNLPQDISGVLEDGAGRLWIGSRNGIYRVAARELEGAGPAAGVTVYDTSDGMRSRECSSGGHPAAVRMRDGTLWFATLRGVSVVDPERLHENTVAPLVAIETVLVNDVARAGVGEIVLEPGRQRVEFQYAGLSLVAPEKVRYRYRLEGFDRGWIEAGAHRAAFYTNLQPGRYVFHAMAMNNDGVWSEQDAALAMRVRPFFWQTLWFYAVLALLAAGVAYLVYAWRVRRVEMVYGRVMEERSRIAREIHDTLAQGIVSISLQLEVVMRLLSGADTGAARAQLEETRLLVRQSLADARSSIWDLRSEGAEELPVRVGRALKTLTVSAGIVGRLQVTGTYRAIGQGVEDELLRIAQEAVTNAVRHAEAGKVEVILTYEMKAFRLLVQDDGRGFDAAAGGPAGHFGLRGMRERAEKIGARLEVRSEAGVGTWVEVGLGL